MRSLFRLELSPKVHNFGAEQAGRDCLKLRAIGRAQLALAKRAPGEHARSPGGIAKVGVWAVGYGRLLSVTEHRD